MRLLLPLSAGLLLILIFPYTTTIMGVMAGLIFISLVEILLGVDDV